MEEEAEKDGFDFRVPRNKWQNERGNDRNVSKKANYTEDSGETSSLSEQSKGKTWRIAVASRTPEDSSDLDSEDEASLTDCSDLDSEDEESLTDCSRLRALVLWCWVLCEQYN